MAPVSKAKRMSDLFASSNEDQDITMATATPYSSEGPTVPNLDDSTTDLLNLTQSAKKRKIANDATSMPPPKKPTQPQPTPHTSHSTHPSLYTPWDLIPAAILKTLEKSTRIRGTKNVVPVVFTRNQNVKSGINRLKTYLGNYKDKRNPVSIPDALKEQDALIAVSAQGDGTTKLVGIMDLARRIVAPPKEELDEGRVESWWMYTMLSSMEVEWRRKKGGAGKCGEEKVGEEEEEEDDAFEPMQTDGTRDSESGEMRKVPVLTVWLTRVKIREFERAFGEQEVKVLKLEDEDD